jgi:hypothetical protein
LPVLVGGPEGVLDMSIVSSERTVTLPGTT